MANVKVVIESTVKPPHIQLDISLREANLLISGHQNITNILKHDIEKAVEFANKQNQST